MSKVLKVVINSSGNKQENKFNNITECTGQKCTNGIEITLINNKGRTKI